MEKFFNHFLNKEKKSLFSDFFLSKLSNVSPTLLPFVLFERLRQQERPMLVIVPHELFAQEVAGDLQQLFLEIGMEKKMAVIGDVYHREQLVPDKEILRIRLAYETLKTPYEITFCTLQSLLKVAISNGKKSNFELTLSCREKMKLSDLTQRLVEWNYDDEIEVNLQGEFAVRGGIVDLFSPAEKLPHRIEFFGDEIDSIRTFSIENQRSVSKVHSITLIPHAISIDDQEEAGLTFLDCFEAHKIDYLLYDMDVLEEQVAHKITAEQARLFKVFMMKHINEIQLFFQWDSPNVTALKWREFQLENIDFRQENSTTGLMLIKDLIAQQIKNYLSEQYRLAILVATPHHVEGIKKYLQAHGIPEKALNIYQSKWRYGLENHIEKMIVLTEREIFYTPHKKINATTPFVEEMQTLSSDHLPDYYSDISEGDYVVHLLHGVAKFIEMKELDLNGVKSEVFVLEFEDDVRLFVPIWQAGMISRYASASKLLTPRSKLGGTRWNRAKMDALHSMRQLASDLLRLQAVRGSIVREPYPKDSFEQTCFEHDFPYQTTIDQAKSIAEVKSDLENLHPMDRLICGDVGYGKTEVAIRAIFKVVESGKQVAFLVPTTVLAQQHFFTLLDRFAPYAFTIDVLSRFRTHAEQKSVLQRLASGGVDVVIGTHRLIQKDVVFKDLGLIVVDEEQRFGVEDKERLKLMRTHVDVLTMSATPIPRTLYMSLSGVRDFSTLMTAPMYRHAVETHVTRFNEQMIAEAIRREIERGGQLFFLHNRVRTIEKMRDLLQRIVPEARYEIGHGQMHEHELEGVMTRFIQGDFDVLVCTTIIESGVDIPNANTIIIDHANRFGLSELYQLRGRVGRSTRQAYSYFLLPEIESMTTDAKKRIAAISKYTQLGSGFRLAMKDLEIRGAGSLLGAEQSGHMTRLGFDLYCRLLRQTVRDLKQQKTLVFPDCELELSFVRYAQFAPDHILAVSIPQTYMHAVKHRIDFYRRLAQCGSNEEFNCILQEMQDRFGEVPQQVIDLFQIMRIRLLASKCGFSHLSQHADRLLLSYRPNQFYSDKQTGLPQIQGKTPHAKLNSIEHILSQMLNKK